MQRIKKIVLVNVLIILCVCTGVQAAEPKALETNASEQVQDVESTAKFDWTRVIEAIIQVESNGNKNARRGNSVGAMQITPVLVAECNNILRSRKSSKRYKLSDRLNVEKSKEMFLLFQSKYNQGNSVEQAIRMWNGGIHYSIKRTQRYFERVMSAMK